ncbi:MAG: hypothetical protein M3160_07360 [Candidatus Eremiobacteraeota bacterium]|nr:hypothetical protein [Candidatus Eremiobacteraeota bacterium]
MAPYALPAPRDEALAVDGKASAMFTLSGVDANLGIAAYAFSVHNPTALALTGRVMGIDRRATIAKSCGLPMTVEPYSSTDTTVLVRLDQCDEFQAIFADVRGGDIAFNAHGPLPAPSVRKHLTLAWLCAAAVIIVAIIWAYLAGIPRITAFAVAPSAISGDVVEATYKSSGAGTLQYDVQAANGERLMSGQLEERQGAIRVALPKSPQSRSYAIRLSVEGLLGGDAQMRMITAIPLPKPKIVVALAPQTARISNLSATPSIVRAGEPVMVTYTASGAAGILQLIDSGGTIWGQAPYSKSGVTWFRVPAFPSNRELRVILRVRQNNSLAQSAIGLMLLGRSDDGAPKSSAPAAFGAGLFEVRPKSVIGGSQIAVKILQQRDNLRFTLLDTQAREIDSRSVARNQRALKMTTPHVSFASRYIVEATFTQGLSEESIVAPITILPAER